MNNDLFMNDTFDNFTFTETEDILAQYSSQKVKSNNLSHYLINPEAVQNDAAGRDLKNEITLNDSLFLTESFLSSNFKNEEPLQIEDLHTNLVLVKSTQHNKCIIDEEGVKENVCPNSLNSTLEVCLKCNLNGRASTSHYTKNENSIQAAELYKINAKSAIDDIECMKLSTNEDENNASKPIVNELNHHLSAWGLPEAVLEKYESRNIKKMFSWQVECLSNVKVLQNGANLVYSAPTSAGKTLVAEILAIKTIFERNKKVLFILPFVSIVREKMYYFQDILGTTGIRVDGFMGSYNPPGGFQALQVAICTIEKANSLVNRMLEEGKLSEIGAILVDEVHLLGDPSRGYLLELLLTKLRYITSRDENVNIQIICMSATLPNLKDLAKWLDAELYTTTFRPIPLHEQAHVCGEIYNSNLKLVRKMSPLPDVGTDTDNILQLCLETIKESCSVLIFCPTKQWCESLSQQIATAFFKLGSSDTKWGRSLRDQLNTELIREVLEQLKYCPVGLDGILRKTVSFGVAFHHAGLTMDERDIIEGAFKKGSLRILVATSTLSSGVNLPARRVIVRTPNFHGKPLDTLTYRQMIGRAGRMGKDDVGESILICQKNDYNTAKKLMSAQLRPVESCLEGAGKLKRAILEVIASGVASTPNDVDLFTKCTLLAVTCENNDLDNPIKETVDFLLNCEFIRLQKCDDGLSKYVATSLGKACLSSSMSPDEGLALFTELEKARQCFVLETELHLIYLVTPYSACHQWVNLDWMMYLDMWEKLPVSMKRVGELVGVREYYIVNATRGKLQTNTSKLYHKWLVHKRFFVALALQDLVNEKSLIEVCARFSCNRGMLQSLQQSASSFAGMVTSFSRQLGWSSVEILISQFQDRLQFGVSRDLLDLMRLSVLNGKMARTLYNFGIESLIKLANADVATIENILHKVLPFQSEKGREGESEFDMKQRNKFRNIWVTGKDGLTEREAAEILVKDARNYLKIEMGLAEAKWDANDSVVIDKDCSTVSLDAVVLKKNEELAVEENVNATFVLPKTPTSSNSRSTGKLKPKSCEKLNEIAENTPKEEEELIESQDTSKSDSQRLLLSPSPVELNISSFSSGFTDLSSFNDSIESSFSNKTVDKFMGKSDKNTASDNNVIESCEGKKDGKIDLVNSMLRSSISTDLNTSDLSLFDSPIDNQQSNEKLSLTDQSLFDESFTLQLSESSSSSGSGGKSIVMPAPQIICSSPSKLSPNETELSNESFLEKAFCSAFNPLEQDLNKSDDILATSLNEDCEDFTTQAKNGRKRTRGSVGEYSDDLFVVQTPLKKIKIKKQRKGKKIDSKLLNNVSINPEIALNEETILKEFPADFNRFDIVNVCKHEAIVETLCKEIQDVKCLSLTLACSRVESTRPTIGVNILKLSENIPVVPKEEHNFTYKNQKIVGFAISWDSSTVYYLSLENPKYNTVIISLLKSLLRNRQLRIKMFDSKEQLKILKHCCDIDFYGKLEDPKIATWLLNPEDCEQNLLAMAITYCPKLVGLVHLTGNSKGVRSTCFDLDTTIDPKMRSSAETVFTWHVVESLKRILREKIPNYPQIYDIEMDSLKCLVRMEINGMGANKSFLQTLVDTMNSQMRAIERKAFTLAGRRFSFTSSTDVAKVLGMFKGRKVSTRKQILEQTEHPVSELVLQWRKLSCSVTKMLYPLIREVVNDRIHGNYITHTSTGRISMHEPNIQSLAKNFNIVNPVSAEEVSISCRSAFVAPQHCVLVSADYCQLELRILAHFSQDNILCDILNKPGDVFKSIAAKWNNIQEKQVTDELRQNAKHLCYGIIYGMGSKTLAQQLSIEEDEAIRFMDSFRNTYPGIKKFIADAVEGCRKNGFVETLFGRRRFLPHITSSSSALKGQAERQAVNTTVQGSAADITKKAMVAIEEELLNKFEKSKPKLILHLHDELLYEVPSKYLMKVATIVKKCMENSVQLSVPFPVKLNTGPAWGQMHELTL